MAQSIKNRIFGSDIPPMIKKKIEAIQKILKQYSISPNNSIMIGDSDSDFYAANENCVPFILRRTKYNNNLQKELNCPQIHNFM